MTQTNIFRIIYSYLCPHVKKYDKIKKKLPTYPNSFTSVTLNTIFIRPYSKDLSSYIYVKTRVSFFPGIVASSPIKKTYVLLTQNLSSQFVYSKNLGTVKCPPPRTPVDQRMVGLQLVLCVTGRARFPTTLHRVSFKCK